MSKIVIQSGWGHDFEQDGQVRHHVYTGIVIIQMDSQHVMIKHEVKGDTTQGSPPELEQQIIEWCDKTTQLLTKTRQIEIASGTYRWT